MLRVDQKRRGLAGADFVARLDGREIASWTVGVNWTGGRRPVEVTVDGERCELRTRGRKHYELARGTATRARADREATSWRARSRWAVTLGDRSFSLESSGRREMTLSSDGEPVGRVWGSGSLRPTYTAELPDDLPAAEQLFLVWMVRSEWVRRQAAAGAAAGGAAAGS